MSQSADPFEFLKNLWGPMGLPMAGVMAPTLDSGEIDKRIAELKSVETWLNMNLSMLRMTLQALEMQKATLAAMQGAKTAQGAAAGTTPVPENPAAFMEAWWKAMQQNISSEKDAEKSAEKDSGKEKPEKK
jgi:hypothetical protein